MGNSITMPHQQTTSLHYVILPALTQQTVDCDACTSPNTTLGPFIQTSRTIAAIVGNVLPPSQPDIRSAVTPRVAHFVRKARSVFFLPEVNNKIGVERHLALVINIDQKKLRATLSHPRIELLVPCLEQAGGTVQTSAVQAASKTLRIPLKLWCTARIRTLQFG